MDINKCCFSCLEMLSEVFTAASFRCCWLLVSLDLSSSAENNAQLGWYQVTNLTTAHDPVSLS